MEAWTGRRALKSVLLWSRKSRSSLRPPCCPSFVFILPPTRPQGAKIGGERVLISHQESPTVSAHMSRLALLGFHSRSVGYSEGSTDEAFSIGRTPIENCIVPYGSTLDHMNKSNVHPGCFIYRLRMTSSLSSSLRLRVVWSERTTKWTKSGMTVFRPVLVVKGDMVRLGGPRIDRTSCSG